MAFFGLTVEGGGACRVEVEQAGGPYTRCLHISNVAIAFRGPPGMHVLSLWTLAGEEFTIALLDRATHPHHNPGLVVDQVLPLSSANQLHDASKGPQYLRL